MRVKKGDTVYISKGKDRGKTGKIISVFPKENKVLVERLNLRKRNIKPRRSGEKGQIIDVEGKMFYSNVKLVCDSCKKVTRIGLEVKEGVKMRVCKKCGASINK